jgi:hypothetical protein
MKMMRSERMVLLLTAMMWLAGMAHAKTIQDVHGFEPHFVLPLNMGMVNIKDFGAVGDGKTDDTAAFQKAFLGDAPRGIYIPAGTYLVRDALVYGVNAGKKKRTCVMGAGVSQTIIKLADSSPGFGDPSKPKAFIHTRPPKQQGEQNMFQYLYHLTIEIGKGNPGAIALNYHSNNTGAIKDVVIRASDPTGSPGFIGLACMDWEVGNAMTRYLTVDGFRTGVSLTRIGNYFTMEHVTVKNCATGVLAGTCSIRDLNTENCDVPLKSAGLTVVVDSTFKGKGAAAIVKEKGGLFARNIKTTGYVKAIASSTSSGDAAGPDVVEYISEPAKSNWPPTAGKTLSLNLPVEESPEIQYPQSPEEWALMPKTGDITDALQQAIDAGKKTIYIPSGSSPVISKTILLRGPIERIMCVGVGGLSLTMPGVPAFRLEDGTSKVVIMELVYSGYGTKCSVGIEQASPRTLVIRHGNLSYQTAPGGAGGKLFAESVCSSFVCRKVHAWLRDMDTEAGGLQALNLANEGGTMWVLGQKCEDFATKLTTINGSTELLGGTYRQNWTNPKLQRGGLDPANPPPLFLVENGQVSLTYVSWGPGKPFDPLVRETRGGETRNLGRKENGGAAALFVGTIKRP